MAATLFGTNRGGNQEYRTEVVGSGPHGILPSMECSNAPPPSAGLLGNHRSGETKLSVVVSFGVASFLLKASNGHQISLSAEENRLFAIFAASVGMESPHEIVTWDRFAEHIGVNEPELRRKQDPALATLLSKFNKRMKTKLGATPNGKKWIGTKKGENGGRYLNESVDWSLDKANAEVRAFSRRHSSVFDHSVDPGIIAEAEGDSRHRVNNTARRKRWEPWWEPSNDE